MFSVALVNTHSLAFSNCTKHSCTGSSSGILLLIASIVSTTWKGSIGSLSYNIQNGLKPVEEWTWHQIKNKTEFNVGNQSVWSIITFLIMSSIVLWHLSTIPIGIINTICTKIACVIRIVSLHNNSVVGIVSLTKNCVINCVFRIVSSHNNCVFGIVSLAIA